MDQNLKAMLDIDVVKNINSASGDAQLRIKASVNDRMITGVYGNSGEGKTSLFNMIAGFLKPNKGRIDFNKVNWYSSANKNAVKTKFRNIAYLFQDSNLYPHFTVRENIAYAIDKNKSKRIDIDGLLEEMGVVKLAARYPHQLSGGQVQRVALARALAQEAKIILMDEPFSALDFENKLKMYGLIENFQKKYGLCILLITHDINDLFRLCKELIWIQDYQADSTISIDQFKLEIRNKLKDYDTDFKDHSSFFAS